jgi:hypothetical protein
MATFFTEEGSPRQHLGQSFSDLLLGRGIDPRTRSRIDRHETAIRFLLPDRVRLGLAKVRTDGTDDSDEGSGERVGHGGAN